MRRKILLVTAHCPHGEIYGAQLRTLHIARILKDQGDLDLVLFPFCPLKEDALHATRDEFNVRRVFYFSRPSNGSLSARLHREFSPYAADTEAKRLSKNEEAEMLQLSEDYDLIWFQGISIPNCLGRKRWKNSVLDIDDVPSQCFAGKAREATTARGRFMALRKVSQWKRREKVFLSRFDVVAVCSEQDRKYFGASERVSVIPNGFEAVDVPANLTPTDPPRIGFIGTLRYTPNADGLRWFTEKVWPKILEKRPDTQLRLVGAATDTSGFENLPNVAALGFVNDSATEIASWSAMIVPILVGGGTRIKIAEAFCRGCPVVSTTQGAYGYQIRNGEECYLVDDAVGFAESCVSLVNNPSLRAKMAATAKALFERELDWRAIAPRIIQTVETALARNSVLPASNSSYGS